MAWNWGNEKARKLLRRKPSVEGDGENSAELRELADKYIRRGYTRQRAYARARKELEQPFRKRSKRVFSGGAVKPR